MMGADIKPVQVRRAAAVLATPVALVVVLSGLHRLGVRVKLSANEPMGFYLMKAIEQQTVITRNSLISFCPAVRQLDFPFVLKGDCPGAPGRS